MEGRKCQVHKTRQLDSLFDDGVGDDVDIDEQVALVGED